MPVVITVLLLITIIVILMSLYFEYSKYNSFSYVYKLLFSFLLIILSLVGFLLSYQGINENHLLYGILMLIVISLYSIKNIVVLLIYKIKDIDESILRYVEIYSSMAFYVLSIIVMTIYFGYSFIAAIIACLFAIVFYASIYILKRNESKEKVMLYFIYAVVISIFASLPLATLFTSDESAIRIHIAAFLSAGTSLIFLSSIFRYGDVIFNTYPVKAKLSNVLTYIFYTLGLTFMSLSITYIFLWS